MGTDPEVSPEVMRLLSETAAEELIVSDLETFLAGGDSVIGRVARSRGIVLDRDMIAFSAKALRFKQRVSGRGPV